MNSIEIEKTYLLKYLPQDLQNFSSKEILDIYIPLSVNHPELRIRKNGDFLEITKKIPVSEDNMSIQTENTIPLTQEEYNTLSKVEGKRVRKIRYQYKYKEYIAEIDIFQDELEGLVLVDFEFEKEEELKNFEIPDFCLCDVTEEEFIAGGMLCGKNYSDIENKLDTLNYKKI
jgi:CYTH domain-containing protein